MDCNCNDGYIFNFNTRKEEVCQKCRAERKEQVKISVLGADGREKREESLEEMLGFGKRSINKEYEFRSVLPDSERYFLTPESMERLEEALDEMYGLLVNGERVTDSYCYGLGIKGNIDRVAYPMLVKAWEEGYSVHRLVSALEYNRMVNREDVEVEEMLDKDIVMVWINDGCSSREIDAVKGLMQTRAIRGKGTIFLTTWLIQACSGLLYSIDEPVNGLAKPVFVEYKRSGNDERESSYIQRLKGVKNTSAAEGNAPGWPENKRVAPTINMSDLMK